jgi:hypothetical protein
LLPDRLLAEAALHGPAGSPQRPQQQNRPAKVPADQARSTSRVGVHGGQIKLTNPTATMQTAVRVNRLLQSLVGVVDMRTEWFPAGTLRHVYILRESTMHDHQIVRNVVSGLEAGLGIRLPAASVRVHADASAFGVAVAPLDVIAALHAPAPLQTPLDPQPVTSATTNGNGTHADASSQAGHQNPALKSRLPANGNGHGHLNGWSHHALGLLEVREPVSEAQYSNGRSNGHANGARNGVSNDVTNGNGSTPRVDSAGTSHPGVVGSGADAAVLDAVLQTGTATLQRVVIERNGGMLRCRVVVDVRGCTYAAAAEVPDGADAEAELAARLTLDAMRAARLTSARLDGIEYARIGDITYVVVALRGPTSPASRSSAAPLVDSRAHAAAQAVLNATAPRGPRTPISMPASGPAELNSTARKK